MLRMSVLALALLSSGCIIHVNPNDSSSIMGDLSISKNAKGNVSTVNGDVHIREHANVKRVTTVNGDIRFDEHVTASSVDSVNGDIRADEHLTISRSVSVVNGDINFAEHANIGDSLSTVNGDVTLLDAKVGDDLETVNGDIEVRGNSVIEGDIHFQWDQHKTPKSEPSLTLGEDVVVNGQIILERPVRLKLATRAQQDKVIKRF